jgi:UDP-N-acetylmuramoyl-tripeptide--D-alanyl-D-alanine ligase
MGIAKTVFSKDFCGKDIFIAEMGARRQGDISTLCKMIKPDYAIFTGVCEQHLHTFGSIDNVYKEKSEILHSGTKLVVCGGSLQEYIKDAPACVIYANEVENLDLTARKTTFTLSICGEKTEIESMLLGEGNTENISLCVRLCEELGLTREDIMRGVAKITATPHRLQLIENGGVYILDDGYNCNPRGAKQAIDALSRFEGRKCIVTPGLVECGVLEERLNGELGEKIAAIAPNKTILVGETLVGAVRAGYVNGGGNEESLVIVPTLQKAQEVLAAWVREGDCVLFLNDLPDVY